MLSVDALVCLGSQPRQTGLFGEQESDTERLDERRSRLLELYANKWNFSKEDLLLF